MMNAIPVLNYKKAFAAGFVHLVVWQVREPVPASAHRFNYRLVYVVDGERVVGYDNERGKGDHKHILGHEYPYLFRDIHSLLDDFWQDVVEATR
jgi:hypothetical protein